MPRTQRVATEVSPAAAEGFRHVLLVHTGDRPETDLIDYAAVLGAQETTIAAIPSEPVMRSLAAHARRQFGVRGRPSPQLHAIPEPDLAWVLRFASQIEADLLVIRTSSALGRPGRVVRRLLSDAPCSVCLLPAQAPARIERVLAGITLDDTGSEVLERSAALCRGSGADQLIAVHCCSWNSLSDDEPAQERFRTERTLDLLQFMARAAPRGVYCTPILEEAFEPRRGLLRAAQERSSDVLIVGRRRGLPPRISRALLRECSIPLLQVLLPAPADGLAGAIGRLFSNPEPPFN